MTAAITLGIDFGDQSCKVAINNGSLDELDISFVSPVIPSNLIINDESLINFESDAKAPNFRQANVGSFKRLLAPKMTDDSILHETLTFVLKKTEKGDLGVELRLADEQHVIPIIELVSVFFERLVALVSSITQRTVTRAVVAIPDWFGYTNQRSMIYALKMAGLENVEMILESTASHINYVVTNLPIYGPETTHNVVFIDIGHTAATMSVLSVVDGTLKTRTAGSDLTFCGQKVDHAILIFIPKENLGDKQQALLECQRAKEALHLFDDMDEGIEIASSATLNGERLYKLVGLSHRIPDFVKTVLKKAGLENDQVHKVVLTGGSMRLLQVRDCISSLFPPGIMEVGSHMAAANGALHASLIQTEPGRFPTHPVLSGLLPEFISMDSLQIDTVPARSHAPLLRPLSLEKHSYALVKDATQAINHVGIYSSEVTIDEPLRSQARLIRMVPQTHLNAPLFMDKYASLLSKAFDGSNKRVDLMQAISMQTKAISLSKSPTETPKYLNNLALLLHKQYKLDNDISHLNQAISSLQYAGDLAANDHPQKHKFFSNLSSLRHTKYDTTRDPRDLDRAIEAKKTAVNLLGEGSTNVAPHLNLYALLLESRFDQSGDIADLTEGIVVLDRAAKVPLRGDIEHACYFNLGVLLQKLYNRNQVIADLDRSIEHQRKAVTCAPDGSNKAMYLNHLGESLQVLFVKRWNLDDLTDSIECHRKAAELVDDNNPSKAVYLNNIGKSSGMYFTHQKSASHLDGAITAQQSAIDLTRMRHSNKGLYLRNLAMLLERRYEHISNIIDLERAIESRKIACTLMPPPKAEHLKALVDSLYNRYTVVHELSDLEEAINNMRKVTEITPDFMPTKIGVLEKLAAYLSKAYDDRSNLSHLQEAISVQQRIVELAKTEDTPDLHRHLFHLGSHHRSLFDRLGNESDLSNGISLLKQALEICDEKHPQRPNYLNHLGSALHHQHLLTPHASHLDESIKYLRKAVESALIDEDKISFTNNLAISLLDQFEILQDARHLSEAIESYRMVVDLTPHNHPNRASRLNNLGVSLRQKFDHSRQIGDLHEAIETLEAAVSSFSGDSISTRSHSYMGNLGTALMLRYKYSGAIEDIDKAIAYHQQSLDLLPDTSIEKAGHYSVLGNSYQTRYESHGELYDLNRAIICQRNAVRETPDGHAHLPVFLNSLANCLRRRVKYGPIKDIEEAISYQEKAIRLTPMTHIHKPTYLSNLGISMTIYFNVTGDVSYLNTGIGHYEKALSLTPEGLPPKPDYLMDLGEALQKRGRADEQMSDLDQAIKHLERAIELTPQEQTMKGKEYHILGDAFYSKFLLESRSEDLQRAIQAYALATQHENGNHSYRFNSAVAWVRCAKESSDPSLKLAYSSLLEILPYLAWNGLSVEAQAEGSMIARSTGCDAAAAAIELADKADKTDKSESLDLALEWLEQGRSILWNQILQLRSPFEKLKDIKPVLAEQIRKTSAELDHHRALGSDLYATAGYWKDPKSEEHFNKQRHLAKQLDVLMMQVQNNPEMHSAVDKITATDLKQCASAGIVVVVNVSELRSDALIIQSPDLPLLHLPLKEISRQHAEKLRKLLSSLVDSPFGLREDANRHGNLVYKRPQQSPDESFKYILRELWLKVVKPIVDLLQLRLRNDTSKLPHIYWCPTGPLTFLPLHAAGLYGTSVETETLFQYAVSSYIPNLRTLCTIVKKQSKMAQSNQIRMLAVFQPETPGQHKLPGTVEELRIIHAHANGHQLSVLNGPQGTRQEVMTALDDHSWIHLSCHGIQHLEVPAYSGLALHDGMLSLLDLIKKPLPQAEFAFLAACQTAMGDSVQFDEAIHLAGGLLVAGFSSVIATMWSVRDSDGPEMTDKVYKHLFDAKQPDIRQSADALHNAIQHLRSKYHDSSFSAWVPYVHMGI